MDVKVFFTVFGSMLLMELGDKTQLATVSFAAGQESRLSVFLGAAAALVLELSVLVRFYRFCDLRGRTVWTYPIGNIVATYAMVFAMTRHLPNTKVVWKGTEYSRP